MAAARSRVPVGSAPWVLAEQRETADMISQEVEGFQFSVQNEMEWLNEHMTFIFAPGNLNVADVFKTPGKLRGKTPRTARKQAAGSRVPLTDIFAPNLSATPKQLTAKSPFQPRIPQNLENEYAVHFSPSGEAAIPSPSKNAVVLVGAMDVDVVPPSSPTRAAQPFTQNHTTLTVPLVDEPRSRRTTLDSFVSARENMTSRLATEEPTFQTEVNGEPEPMQIDAPLPELPEPTEPKQLAATSADDEMMDDEDLRSPSDVSSPIKPVFRKSSLNFSSLPAREPLGKTSFGARNSQFEKKSMGSFGRTTVGPRVTGAAIEIEKMSVDVNDKAIASQESLEASKTVGKTSTQRLADQIKMLGQSSTRMSHLNLNLMASFEKSGFSRPSQPIERTLEQLEIERTKTDVPSETRTEVDEEDWIAPIVKPVISTNRPISEIYMEKHQSSSAQPVVEPEGLQPRYGSPARPLLHKKMASTTVLESPTKIAMAPDPATQKQISVSNPTPYLPAGTTTPPASPPRSPGGRKMLDGPLSASKAKFYSVLRSAKGIFASSAGVSAHAKLEALSPGRAKRHVDEAPPSPTAYVHPKPALFASVLSEAKSGRTTSPEGRRLRSSTEQKRKEEEDRHRRVGDDLEKVRDKERQKATAAAQARMNKAQPPKYHAPRSGAVSRAETEASKEPASDDNGPPVPPKPASMLPSSKIRDPRRVPVPKAAPKDAARAKPAPVMIRMPSQKLNHPPPSTASLSQSLHDTLPPPPPKMGPSTTKAALTNHANASSTSLKSTISAKRAITVATKKQEQEHKLALRKADQKRDFEQKRAQRLETERKLEQQRRAAEQNRVQEARKAAQRQAEEAKRKEASRPESRQNALANALQTERAAAQNQHPRSDVPSARPVSRLNMVPESNRLAPQINPVKPPKRALPHEHEEQASQRPPSRAAQNYQTFESKRRKTGDEEQETLPQRTSTLAPPIRQSTVKKASCPISCKARTNIFQDATKFGHHTPGQNPSMFIKTVTAQHQLQLSKQPEMAKFASGRIPFAGSTSGAQTPAHGSQTLKTPIRPANLSQPPTTAAKSSPQYPQSELIELPEIMTDSEDEDSDNEFQAPSWTESPFLKDLLRQQQLIDPETIFGPVAPIKMDEVFAGSVREKKFRDRTSSAHWSNLDKLNDEERKKDRKARERLMKDGGWDFVGQKAALGDNSPRP